MLKDNTEFRDRFARWKAGELVYENGRPLPAYEDGKGSRKWTPNQQTRRSISRYEGDAMVKDTIDPLTGKMAKKNASFESVADSFVNTFSPETWEKVKGNDALLQALYHYAYNIGPGKFKERTLPMVDAYYKGEATVRDVLNAMWAHGDKKLRGLANRRIAERAMVEKALSDQFPAASLVPYRNDDYNYYRANQLGYKPDETGHMPSRDEVTGMYLKSPAHPTIMKSVVLDLSEGYQPYYNKQDGRIYSQPMFDVKQWVEGLLFKGLPGYGDGKTPFRYIYAGKENKPIRITNDEMGRVFQGLEVTPYKTKVTPAPKVMNTPAPQKSAFNGNEVGNYLLNKTRQVLYNRIDPYSYDINEAISQLLYKGRRTKKNDVYDALWARYLNRSNSDVGYNIDDYLQPAIYKPNKGTPIGQLYRLTSKSWDGDEDLNPLGDRQLYEMLKSGKTSDLGDGVGGTKTGLGTYTRSLGEDEKGKYMSYYDEWDISPVGNKEGSEGKDQTMGIGTPFSVYDRRYYTDEEALYILSEYDKMFQSIQNAAKNQSVRHEIYSPKPYNVRK